MYRAIKRSVPDRILISQCRESQPPQSIADKNIGEWNKFRITMKGDRLTVELNGKVVIENPQLPGIPPKGPIGLQHHGSMTDGQWVGPPSLVQFRNIFIKEL